MRAGLIALGGFVGGVALGATVMAVTSGRSFEPSWALRLEQKLEVQAALMERQRLASDALGGAVNELRSSRRSGSTAPSCMTSEELRAVLAGVTRTRDTSAGAESSSDARRREQDEKAGENAREEAARLIERAVSAGVWDEERVNEFHGLLGQMTPTQRDKAMSTLVTALNDHQLKLAAHAPF